MSKGFIVVDGVQFPITDVALRKGRIVVTAEIAVLHKPMKRISGPVTVFGADGVGVCQGRQELVIGPDAPPITYTIDYELTVGSMADNGRPFTYRRL